VMRSLKALSSEMDPAEIRFILQVFVKEIGVEVFRKIFASPRFRATSYSWDRRKD
jgi:hypothetical protein